MHDPGWLAVLRLGLVLRLALACGTNMLFCVWVQTMRGELRFDIQKTGTLHGFTAWFSVYFQSLEEGQPQQVLSTGPLHP